MPILLDLTAVLSAGRYAVAAYATVATIAATACLALHLVTLFDRRALRRHPGAKRPEALFVPLDMRSDTAPHADPLP